MPERVPILFVDDEAPMRQAVTQWLELAGFELMVHEDASSAAAKLSAGFPGIVVTDLKMEGMDGLALLRRAQEADPELPVVVITGHGDVQIAVEAMRLGAYDFIEKPFVPERFLEVVRHASEKRQLVISARRHMSDRRSRIGQVGDSWRAAAKDDDDLLHQVSLTSHLEPPFGLSRVEDMTFKMDRLTGSLTQATRSRATT